MAEGQCPIPGAFWGQCGQQGSAVALSLAALCRYLLLEMWCPGPWLRAGLGSVRFTAALSDLEGLSQAK